MEFSKKYKKFLYIITIAISFQLLFAITGYLNNSYNIYLNLTYLFCGTVALGMVVMTFFMNNSSFYKYLGLSFVGVSILEYLKVILESVIVNEEIYRQMRLFLNYAVGNYEKVLVIMSIIFMVKKISNIKVIALSIGCLGLVLIYVKVMLFYHATVIQFLILGIILFIICCILMEKYKFKDKKVFVYMMIIALNSVFKIFIIGNMYIYTILSNTLRICAYFYIYEGVSERVFNFEIVNIKNTVKINEKERKKIYKKIETRSNIIDQLNKMKKREETYYYNIIDGFNDAIIIQGENIKYANEKAMALFNLESNSEFEEDDFTKRFIYKNKGDKRAKIETKDGLIDVEIYVAQLEGNTSITYIKYIKEILEYEGLLREYEAYLRNEDMKNEFYTNISHELRTPINVISSALELNEIKIKNRDFEGIKEINDKIKKNCLRLIRTINNFIDANKFAEGYLTLNKRAYNIVEVVEEVVLGSVPYIREKKMDIIFDATDEEIILEIDRDMIERAVLNIISNSVKYRKNDGERIDVNIIKNKHGVYILVSNNGRQIDKNDEKYIFDEFKKLDNGLNRENEGSGLGLFLCKEIIKAHKGMVHFHSTNEGKNEFVIKLNIDNNIQDNVDINYNINGLEEKIRIEFSDIV